MQGSLGTASLTKGHQSTKLSLDQPGQVGSPFCTQQRAVEAPSWRSAKGSQ